MLFVIPNKNKTAKKLPWPVPVYTSASLSMYTAEGKAIDHMVTVFDVLCQATVTWYSKSIKFALIVITLVHS